MTSTGSQSSNTHLNPVQAELPGQPPSQLSASEEGDWGELDDELLDPDQHAIRVTAKVIGLLLLLTWVLPIGRAAGAPVNVWDRFGIVSTWELIRLVMPGLVGLVFVVIGFFVTASVRQKASVMSASLILMLLSGVNPFEILSVVTPPIDGRVAELMFNMTDGQYFPREDTTHTALLGLGLCLLGVAGRYRATVQTSDIGRYLLVAASAILVTYYVWPYGSGKVPALRNAALYSDYHAFPDTVQAGVRALENRLYQLDPEIIYNTHFQKLGRDARLLGQVKLSAVYFVTIYFVPLMLILLALPSLRPSRYLNHRTVTARLVGFGASAYLLAFLFPLILKESGKQTGDGFLAALRNYILFGGTFLGCTVVFSATLHKWLEPERSNDALPQDPLSWKQA